MPPKIHVVRHAQGEHNVTHNFEVLDPLLTPKGKEQCQHVKSIFKHHNDVDIVFSSPLRRTIQTAALSFGPALARKDVPFVLLPLLQEISAMNSDTGMADTPNDMMQLLPKLFAEGEIEFDIKKTDASALTPGWNHKQTGYWAYNKKALSKRAADLRNWLFQRPENEILLVTHGAIAHFITEDWDVDDPMLGTAYANGEHREFLFTSASTPTDAHMTETKRSKSRRGPRQTEKDPHSLDEVSTAAGMAPDLAVNTVVVGAD